MTTKELLDRIKAQRAAETPAEALVRLERLQTEGREVIAQLEAQHAASTEPGEQQRLADLIEGQRTLALSIEGELYSLFGRRQTEEQRKRAGMSSPRGRDGRTIAELVQHVAGQLHRGAKPREIWPLMRDALTEWGGQPCELIGEGRKLPEQSYMYTYDRKDTRRKLAYKTFSELCPKAK